MGMAYLERTLILHYTRPRSRGRRLVLQRQSSHPASLKPVQAPLVPAVKPAAVMAQRLVWPSMLPTAWPLLDEVLRCRLACRGRLHGRRCRRKRTLCPLLMSSFLYSVNCLHQAVRATQDIGLHRTPKWLTTLTLIEKEKAQDLLSCAPLTPYVTPG